MLRSLQVVPPGHTDVRPAASWSRCLQPRYPPPRVSSPGAQRDYERFPSSYLPFLVIPRSSASCGGCPHSADAVKKHPEKNFEMDSTPPVWLARWVLHQRINNGTTPKL
ncbi:hypothetical protein PAXINDRAFT_21083 [Paxillus involutus ATCC 200175]|uniref:Uncharacterized protein n=1 Tax=Paxillus involutus ATCC 200175 TaxID=664439 RepID=A0A0C9STV5_PAXIN|nr:hypothetical protein PAXINDRAFT_21083 [Paxillus involutus ATCC 200175]